MPCTPTTHSSSRVAFENVHRRRRRRQSPQTTTAAKCSSQQQLSHRKSKIVHLATTVLGCRKSFTQHSLTVHFSMQPVSPFAPFLEQDVTSLFSDLLHRSSCNRNVKYNLFHKKNANAEKFKKKTINSAVKPIAKKIINNCFSKNKTNLNHHLWAFSEYWTV